MECPVCENGTLKSGKIKESLFGVFLGEFPADICRNCNESFTDEKTTKKIEEIAKAKGIWGLGKITKISKVGNSLIVRVPKAIAEFLKLRDGEEAFVHPDGSKLVVEAKNSLTKF